MDLEKLVEMANDISNFFDGEGGAGGIDGVALHIQRYWEPRMRRQILAHVAAGGEGLSDTARAALGKVTAPPAAIPAAG